MAACKDCFHWEACSTIYEKAFREKPEKYTFLSACPLFKDKEKRGRWLPQMLLGQRIWDCSECKTIGSPHWKRCPVCEAKMDLE